MYKKHDERSHFAARASATATLQLYTDGSSIPAQSPLKHLKRRAENMNYTQKSQWMLTYEQPDTIKIAFALYAILGICILFLCCYGFAVLTFQLWDYCSHHTSHTEKSSGTLYMCLKLNTAYTGELSEHWQAKKKKYFIIDCH